jgi:hypothetical protein
MIFCHKFYNNPKYTNPNKKKSPSDICFKPKKLYKIYKLYNLKKIKYIGKNLETKFLSF